MIVIAGCSNSERKAENSSPEENIKEQLNRFSAFARNNQTDSLKAIYPQIELTDSVRAFELNEKTVITKKNPDGNVYTVTLNPEMELTVSLGENGTVNIIDSKGLFVFPNDKLEIARQSGMYDPSLSDKEMAERIADEKFFEYISSLINTKTQKILKIGETDYFDEQMLAYTKISNLTDQPIRATDYKIIIGERYYNAFDGESICDDHVYRGNKDIAPNGSMTVITDISGHGGDYVKDVKITLSKDERQKRFFKYSGHEYQDYLKSK